MGGQQANLPAAIIWLQALSVPILGLFAGWIAYRQWQTADRKVQLDLFDRRFDVFNAAREVAAQIINDQVATSASVRRFSIATDKAPYLFGSDVTQALSELAIHIHFLDRAIDRIRSNETNLDQWHSARERELIEVERCYNEMKRVIKPYMDLTYKRPNLRFWKK